MITNVGMLTVRNEVDVIDEFLDDVEKYFEVIVVMDDSDDGTYEKIARRDIVDYLVKFSDVYDSKSKRIDGQKQHIFKYIQQKYGGGVWVTNLNADAFFGDDPNLAIEFAESKGFRMVRWRTYDFRMHISDKIEYDKDPEVWVNRPVREKFTWCLDQTWVEWLQFKADRHHFFDVNQHSRVIPHNFEYSGVPAVPIIPVLLHYPTRSPEAVVNRRNDRAKTGFRIPEFYKEIIDGGFFLEKEQGFPYVKFESQNVQWWKLGIGNERFKQGIGGFAHPELLKNAPW